jgi:hypothetical protein
MFRDAVQLESNPLLARFAPDIAALPERSVYSPSELLTPQFLLEQENTLSVFYAPFDVVNTRARIAIVGITPGWQQMEISFRVARRALLRGAAPEEASWKAKLEASFAGTMRRNLIAMLNDLGLPKLLNIRSAGELFTSATELLHTTSVFRYPVFNGHRNYTGSSPMPSRSKLLMKHARKYFSTELKATSGAVIVPLGKTVGAMLQTLLTENGIPPDRVLLGFPHPSGANGHRVSEFETNKERMRQTLASAWQPMSSVRSRIRRAT